MVLWKLPFQGGGAVDPRIKRTQLDLLASNISFTAVTGGMIAALGALGAWSVSGGWMLGTWAAAYGVLLLLRLWGIRAYHRDGKAAERTGHWGVMLSLNVMASGIMWLLFGLVTFHPGEPVQALFVATILIGMIAASSASLSPYLPAHLAFSFPTAIGLVFPFLASGTTTMVLLGLMSLVYLVVNVLSARAAERMLIHSIGLRIDNEHLVETLARSNADLEQFAYVASHDLRAPLRQVASYVALLERRYVDQLDDTAREFIGYARDGAMRMDRMIVELLEYSRIGRRRVKETVPLRAAVDDALANLKVTVAETGASVDVADALPRVMGDRLELTRLFQNLIGNALKYRHPDRPPEVTVTATVTDAEVQVSVIDNGIGMAFEHLDRIFAVFQRLHTGQEYDGTGIGLAICRKVVERHGGRIWVDSQPGQGSTFHVALPVTPSGDEGMADDDCFP